jgi:hypothetical protein
MRTRRPVVYPFLLALYPVIALYAENANRDPVSQVVLPIILMTAAAALTWTALRFATGNTAKAGLLTVVIVAFFFTVSVATESVNGGIRTLSRFWVLTDVHVWPPLVIVSEAAAALAIGYFIAFRLRNPDAWTARLNLLSLLLISMPLCSLIASRAGEPATTARASSAEGGPTLVPIKRLVAQSEPRQEAAAPGQRMQLPDVYYIVLDGYARSDVMLELFDYDNGPFLEWLQRKGFYVARQSTSNYCQTPLSLSSALNSMYLNGLIPPTAHQISQLADWIGHGAVVETFRGLGYQFVTFPTGFCETEHPEADVYLADAPYLSPFHQFLISRTALACLLPGPRMRDGYVATRERTTFLLETVPQVARRPEPTFTLAHMLAPYPPFVFGSHGEDVSPHELPHQLTDGDRFRELYGDSDRYAEGYRNEAMYLTQQVQLTIDRILANSPEPPVIILQSDHGSGMRLNTRSLDGTDLHERMSIFNAYYMPDNRTSELYQSISPVNSFRVVFNAYFGASLKLLPDRSYYSTWIDPFEFIDVTDRVRPRQDGGRTVAAAGTEARPGLLKIPLSRNGPG